MAQPYSIGLRDFELLELRIVLKVNVSQCCLSVERHRETEREEGGVSVRVFFFLHLSIIPIII